MNKLLKLGLMSAAVLALAQTANAAIISETFDLTKVAGDPVYNSSDYIRAQLSYDDATPYILNVALTINGADLAGLKLQRFYLQFAGATGDLKDWSTSAGNGKVSGDSQLPGKDKFDISVGSTGNLGLTTFTITKPDVSPYFVLPLSENNPDGYKVAVHLSGSSSWAASTPIPPGSVPEPSTYFAGLSALGMLLLGYKNRK